MPDGGEPRRASVTLERAYFAMRDSRIPGALLAVQRVEGVQAGRPYVHYRFLNESGEMYTVGTADEMKRVLTILYPEGNPNENVVLFATADSDRAKLLEELGRTNPTTGRPFFPGGIRLTTREEFNPDGPVEAPAEKEAAAKKEVSPRKITPGEDRPGKGGAMPPLAVRRERSGRAHQAKVDKEREGKFDPFNTEPETATPGFVRDAQDRGRRFRRLDPSS